MLWSGTGHGARPAHLLAIALLAAACVCTLAAFVYAFFTWQYLVVVLLSGVPAVVFMRRWWRDFTYQRQH